MTNATWVCFDCRQVVRAPTTPRRNVICPHCRASCFCLGREIPVPPKHRMAAWRQLRSEMRAVVASWTERRARAAVARRHHIEKRIGTLERLPRTPSRDDAIEQLRKELAGEA
jgi:hypothetical protein